MPRYYPLEGFRSFRSFRNRFERRKPCDESYPLGAAITKIGAPSSSASHATVTTTIGEGGGAAIRP